MTDQRSPGIHLPTWEEMKGRMFMTGLVIIAFVLLGFLLNSNGWLAQFTTVLVITISTLIHTSLRGHALNRPERSRPTGPEAERLIETVREAPFLRPLTTNLAGRIVQSLAAGIGVAIAEFIIHLSLFGGDQSWLSGVVSLSLVIFPMYSAIGIYESRFRYPPSTSYLAKLRDALLSWLRVRTHMEGREVPPIAAAVLWSTARTLISAISRAFMMLTLEPIFRNWYAVGFILAMGLILVVGGLRVLGEVGRHVAETVLPPRQVSTNSEELPDSH